MKCIQKVMLMNLLSMNMFQKKAVFDNCSHCLATRFSRGVNMYKILVDRRSNISKEKPCQNGRVNLVKTWSWLHVFKVYIAFTQKSIEREIFILRLKLIMNIVFINLVNYFLKVFVVFSNFTNSITTVIVCVTFIVHNVCMQNYIGFISFPEESPVLNTKNRELQNVVDTFSIGRTCIIYYNTESCFRTTASIKLHQALSLFTNCVSAVYSSLRGFSVYSSLRGFSLTLVLI